MGGLIAATGTIGGTVAAPGLPLLSSPLSGLYQLTNGIGETISGFPYSALDFVHLSMGPYGASTTILGSVAGSPFAAGTGATEVTVSPNGLYVYAANTAGNLVFAYSRNMLTGALTAVGAGVATGASPTGVIATLDGKYLYVANNQGLSISAYSINSTTGALTPLVISPISTPGLESFRFAISSDNLFLYAVNTGPYVSCYSINSSTGNLTLVATYTFPVGWVFGFSVKISPDGLFVYVTANTGAEGYVFTYQRNATTGALTLAFSLQSLNSVDGLAISPDGSLLVAADQATGSVNLYARNKSTGQLLLAPGSPYSSAGSGGLENCMFSLDGNYVYANGRTSGIYVWLVSTLNNTLSPVGGSPFVSAAGGRGISLSPDGASLYVTSATLGVQAFQTTNATGSAIFALFDTTGGLNGSLLLNSNVQVNGSLTINGGVPISSATLAASSGSSLVGFIQAGAGAVAQTVQTSLRETVSVTQFGADSTGASDSYAAFVATIAALPATGGAIKIPRGTWNLSAVPTWGTKSIFWDIDAGAVFTGAGSVSGTGTSGKFPTMSTNPAQVAVGPWVQSQNASVTPVNGGVAALNAEMLQPSTYVGQSVGFYAGARSSAPQIGSNIWAINCLVQADVGFAGVAQGIEVDVNTHSASANRIKGISIAGVGEYNVDVGLELIRGGTTKYTWGINVRNSVTGIRIENDGITTGIQIGVPAGQITPVAFATQQLADTKDTIYLQRFTDTTPTGSFIRATNAANNASLFRVDVLGNITNAGSTISNQFTVGAPVGATSAGFQILQSANGNDMFYGQRNTDTGPTGNLLRFVNAADNANLFIVDASANITTAGNINATGSISCNILTAANARLNTAAQSNAGTVNLGGTTQTTIGANGAASALTANPLGYLIAYVGTTKVVIPYYNA